MFLSMIYGIVSRGGTKLRTLSKVYSENYIHIEVNVSITKEF